MLILLASCVNSQLMETKALKKYLKKSSKEQMNKCGDLLSSTEALKHFGKVWGEYKTDLMVALTSLEYEWMTKFNFNKEEFEAVKYILGNIALFFKGCKAEADELLAKQTKK